MLQQELDRLLRDAKANPALKEALLATRGDREPVASFCGFCQRKGYQITAGELFAAGLIENDAKLRSVNGGGVNAIDGWDDAYEQFFTRLIWSK